MVPGDNQGPSQPPPGRRALLTLAGVAVGVLAGGSFREDDPVIAWCLFAALGMSCIPFRETLAQTGFISQTTLFFYLQFFGLCWLILLKTFAAGWGDLPSITTAQLLWIMYVGLGGGMLGYSIYFYGLRTLPASTASIVSSIEIVTAFTLSALLLRQPPTLREIAGAVLIVLAIVLVSRGDNESFREKS